jgi:4-amino-4-deoxy-L-arabinose transferase-like glycosyltransferase
MSSITLTNLSKNRYIKIAVVVIVLFRLLLLDYIPLLDKTESRYAEIARMMNETREWIVLQIDYGVPFWAKPPLSTWLSSLSFDLFGVNEFAARLPSFFIAMLVVYLIAKFFREESISFYIPAFILLTIPEYLIHAGVTSTDSALLLSISLTMLSFWKAVNSDKKNLWSYLFFVGIGLGLLAKGPIIIILTAPPVFIWCLLDYRNRFKLIWQKLPWILGIIISLLIAVPWYYLVEKETPGYFDYFIVGEHFKRFTESGWSGDKYGFAKSQPLGIIWLFLLGFGFPWIEIVLFVLWKKGKTFMKDRWVSFLVLWLFWTPVFFTFSKSSIHTYILPCTVPIALIIMHYWKDEKNWIKISSVFPIATILAFLVLLFSNKKEELMNTDKYLLSRQQILTANSNIPLYYWSDISYSGRFYSNGKAILIHDLKELDSVFDMNKPLFFMLENKSVEEVPQRIHDKIKLLDQHKKRGLYTRIEE